MFSYHHAIWKFANAGDELNDWLPYAEELVQKWSTQSPDDVKFQTTFEIIIAAYLLKDNLLPASAKVAFADIMFEAINEATVKKLHLKSLHLHPLRPGRKEDRKATFIKCREVMDLIKNGMTATEAYKVVAEKHFKSPDTIRREYERIIKKKACAKSDRGNR